MPRGGADPHQHGGQVTAQTKVRINEEIRIRQVRLIDEKGNQLGVVETQNALDMAREKGLDLVEVAPDARPPVCKLLDFGKQKYLAKKKEHQAKRKQHQVVIKEVRVRPKIDTHDLETKLRKAREFLLHGDKLQVNMLFRGREHGFRDRGLQIMLKIREDLSEVAKVEREPRMEGNRLVMILQPKAQSSQPAGPRPTQDNDDDDNDDEIENENETDTSGDAPLESVQSESDDN